MQTLKQMYLGYVEEVAREETAAKGLDVGGTSDLEVGTLACWSDGRN